MKPNLWVLCCILLLCFASAYSKRDFFDGDREFLYEKSSKERRPYEARDSGNSQDIDGYNSIDSTPILRDDPEPVDKCKEKCGTEAGVSCDDDIIGDGEIKCKCDEEMKSYDPKDKKCKADKCKEKCGTETGVSCDGDIFGDAELKCKCDKAMESYDTKDKKCKADKCKEKCGTETGVSCDGDIFGDAELKCKCDKAMESYDTKDKKCKDDKCKKTCGTSEDVECEGDPFGTEAVKCKCDDSSKSLDPRDKKCKVDKCEEKCGSHEGVSCEGDRFSDDVKCICDEPKKSHDPTDKECKVDKCWKKCGKAKGVNCEGDRFGDEEDIDCICDDPNQSYDSTDKKCKNDKCKIKCGTAEDVKCEGEKFGTSEVTCKCEDTDKSHDPKVKQCRVPCTDGICKNGAKCQSKFCNCLNRTSGDDCATVDDCQSGRNICGDDEQVAICWYNVKVSEAKCNCTDKEKAFDYGPKICRNKCEKSEDCKSDKEECKDALCKCKTGLEGEDCSTVTGCKDLKETCEKAEADCVYDVTKVNKANCYCPDEDYKYVEAEKKCVLKWCLETKCGAGSKCDFKEKVGLCKCTDAKKYYDYKSHQCLDPDPCVLKKITCKANEICKDGTCTCKDNFESINETCHSKLCGSDTCFKGGICNVVGDSFTCTCPEKTFFNGKECKDSKCISKDFKTCGVCPSNLKWNEKEKKCDPEKGFEICSDDCGFGYCLKPDNKKNTCACISSIAEKKNNTCVLKSSLCASGKLVKDSSKCNCTGIYTEAEDGLTCQLKTCTEKMQLECKLKGATCMMTGNRENLKYKCKCPRGYGLDLDTDKCIDTCSLQRAIEGCHKQGMVCFNSDSSENDETGDCQCFPPLKNANKNCSDIDDNVYVIRNIPVLKKTYERNDEIDKVLLNGHLVESMKQTFAHFSHGYLMDYELDGDKLNCSVWVQFQKDPIGELQRLKHQARTFECTDCDSSLTLWPPKVLLGTKDLKVKEEKLTFCTKDAKDKLCGEGADCVDNKCSCRNGYRPAYMSTVITAAYRIQRCEDIDECATGTHRCPKNTTCVNDPGDYHCECLSNFKKKKDTVFSRQTVDKEDCFDMCTPNPCAKGECKVKDNGIFDCSCSAGYGGTLCDRADVNFASAKKSVVTVGSILGVLLGVTLIAFFLYYRRIRKNSYSEDFAPAQKPQEMEERRPPMRGMINRSYE